MSTGTDQHTKSPDKTITLTLEAGTPETSGEHVRHRRPHLIKDGEGPSSPRDATDMGFVFLENAENEVEAQRIANNYMFGFKKWKSHVTARPLEVRSDVVKSLYSDLTEVEGEVSTIGPGNILYVVLFGWWVALVYVIVSLLMFLTVLGWRHGLFCLKLARYFFWPFDKFVLQITTTHRMHSKPLSPGGSSAPQSGAEEESTPLLGEVGHAQPRRQDSFWRHPSSYVWLILGCPLVVIAHTIAFLLSWLMVVYIPVSKVHSKTIREILLMQPEKISIEYSRESSGIPRGHIIMYTYRAVNVYYYKYTVDGMNVIAVNLLLFVILAILMGYLDREHKVISSDVQLYMSLLAIIPLAYYIGMGITSISAQSNFAIGAVLNATFGSVVELVLYIFSLVKGITEKKPLCYRELVKSALVGTLLATMLLIPGLCMIIGGLRHSTQTFNSRSAGVSSTLLFISVAGVFAPTIFSKAYGTLQCQKCVNSSNYIRLNTTENITFGLQCSDCEYSIFGIDGNESLYNEHIRPLVYVCAIILPVAYIIGLIFSHKTHRAHVYDTYKSDNTEGHGHVTAHWGRLKSIMILVVSTVLMSLCAELVTDNIQPLLQRSGVSVYFIGVTLLALVPDIPEIVNGIQFALKNNIFLSIEVGSCIATQVCMLQIPILVLANVIYDMQFYMIFSDIHLFSTVFALLLMNYMFQDGKCNYFQGAALCLVYCALIAMYFFAPNPRGYQC